MTKFKKGMAMLLAAALCAGLPAHTAKAVFCSGSHSLYFAGHVVQEGSYSHKVYHNSYYGDEQQYSICNVKTKAHYDKICCSNCEYYTLNPLLTEAVHSLADDPDHNK